MSETLGLLLGRTVGGWLYQGLSIASPFVFEAGCMLIAVAAFSIARSESSAGSRPLPPPPDSTGAYSLLSSVSPVFCSEVSATRC
jgi:hypothetical protein